MALAEPDIASLASLIGHEARAAMLMCLMGGRAHTATELALEADITAQTASSHLAKLLEGDLLVVRKQGRHKYFQLKNRDVAKLLENMLVLGAMSSTSTNLQGPADPGMRYARVCYDHLAGAVAVKAFDMLVHQGLLTSEGDQAQLTQSGEKHFGALGYRPTASRRPQCRACLDWSERRSHLAGELGEWLLNQALDKRWAVRDSDSRTVAFSTRGERAFFAMLSVETKK